MVNKTRIGKLQKEILSRLYNLKYSKKKFITIEELDDRLEPIDIGALYNQGFKSEVIEIMEKNRKNIYLSIWKAVKNLQKVGLVETSKRHYHYYRRISLTENGWNWLETRRKDIIGKTWQEKATERCRKCPNWTTERMYNEDGDVRESGVEGCYHSYDITEWNCKWLKEFGNMNPDLTNMIHPTFIKPI